MKQLIELLKNNQYFLVKRTLYYAKLHHYTKYTSTLEGAWIASIAGLSNSIILAITNHNQVPEIDVDHDFEHDPISSFGILEAKKHRNRGITLEMFLGLTKYYRQSYLDLVSQTELKPEKQSLCLLWLNRFFDHMEIAFCREWSSLSKETLVLELQKSNREMTNTKNKYLTIFESIPTPVILLDTESRLVNLNYAAQCLLQDVLHAPGYIYYNDSTDLKKLDDVMPWIIDEFDSFIHKDVLETRIEKDYLSPREGKKNLVIQFHRMLDVSGKFSGTVIILIDLTEQKQIEEQLRYMSFHDPMTGLYNRAYLKEEIIRVTAGRNNPLGIISCDIDGLKLVNDLLGHHAGDTLIKTVSRILVDSFRKCDVVARMGGDEFIIFMPTSDKKTIQEACQRIRDSITKHNQTDLEKPISVSTGWANGNVFSYKDIHELVKKADSLMYINKRDNKPKYNELFNQRFQLYGEELFK